MWPIERSEALFLSGLPLAEFDAIVDSATGPVEIAKVPHEGAKVCYTNRIGPDGRSGMGFGLIAYDGDGGDARRALAWMHTELHVACAA